MSSCCSYVRRRRHSRRLVFVRPRPRPRSRHSSSSLSPAALVRLDTHSSSGGGGGGGVLQALSDWGSLPWHWWGGKGVHDHAHVLAGSEDLSYSDIDSAAKDSGWKCTHPEGCLMPDPGQSGAAAARALVHSSAAAHVTVGPDRPEMWGLQSSSLTLLTIC